VALIDAAVNGTLNDVGQSATSILTKCMGSYQVHGVRVSLL
jgi:hypothetical protein